mmetsp:Transcript_14895/g.44201  ORF Transcript_14895/g.44201 Transcript_14895/m.44201 type:complete len:503 (-) Transcript_14895:176-1684(-)
MIDGQKQRLDADLRAAGTSPELRLRAAAAALDRLSHASATTAPFLQRVKREYEIQIAAVASKRRSTQRLRTLHRTKAALENEVAQLESRVAAAEAAVRASRAKRRWWAAAAAVRDQAREAAAAAAAEARAVYEVTPREMATRLVVELGRDSASDATAMAHHLARLTARRDDAVRTSRRWGSPNLMADLRQRITDAEHELAAAEAEVEAQLASHFDSTAVRRCTERLATTLVQCEDEYAAAMAAGDVPRAAVTAARSPHQFLQTPETWAAFEAMGVASLFEYACALIEVGASAACGVECATVAVRAGRLDVLENWILSGAVQPTIELARGLHAECGVAGAETQYTTLASLAVAACERVGPPLSLGAASADGHGPELTAPAVEEAVAGYIEAGILAMELLVRRGKVRGALAFGAMRGVTPAVCTALALREGSLPLAAALGRAAAHRDTSLIVVARRLPSASQSKTAWQQWNSAKHQQRRNDAEEAYSAAFAQELLQIALEELSE